jgi:hypothetical protein
MTKPDNNMNTKHDGKIDVTLDLDEDVERDIRAAAKIRGISPEAFIERCLEHFISLEKAAAKSSNPHKGSDVGKFIEEECD